MDAKNYYKKESNELPKTAFPQTAAPGQPGDAGTQNRGENEEESGRR